MNALPEVEEKLENGTLNMTNALKAQQIFRAESKQRPVTVEEKRSVLLNLENISTRKAEKVLAETYPNTHTLTEKIKPVSPNQNLIQFYVDDETLLQIEELKARYSHQMPEGKMQDLLKILIKLACKKSKPRKRITVQTTKQTTTRTPDISNPSKSRYISAEVKREMEKSRGRGCTHTDATGYRCGSSHFLQLDHIIEFSRGGPSEAQNLRWMCGFHNRNRGETRRGPPQTTHVQVE
jgi:hypothetical protein